MPVARYEVEELRRLARRQGDGPKVLPGDFGTFQPLGLGKKLSKPLALKPPPSASDVVEICA